MIAYADTGFLVSLYGQDTHSATATALVRSKPVFLLTSLGETEFTNAVELRVFRKEWTRREAHGVRRQKLLLEGHTVNCAAVITLATHALSR